MDLLFSEYLSPTNPIASGIVTFLQYLFILWLSFLLGYGIWLLIKWIEIKKNQNVQLLVDARQTRDSNLEEGEQIDRPEGVFGEFCQKRSLRENTFVSKHLKAIFYAGWDESRLEASELLNHTTSNLFRLNGLFRSVLAVFIVIGLLGTLFGLTDSLIRLTPALEASTANETSIENSERMTQALSSLLAEIKGAFAPSIWGIGFTVLGVIFYAAYLQFACQPVKSVLERLTLTVWIPQLYPTTSQKLIQTLQKSEAQMRRGFETATRVNELVVNVQENISDFNQNLKRANDITQPLHQAVSQVNETAKVLTKFSGEFAQNVTKLTGFQDEIRNLYQKFQEAANQKMEEQNRKLDETRTALNNYEDTNIKSRQEINQNLKKFIEEATEANTSINRTNREYLEKIQSKLESFDAPIQQAADQIRGTFQNFDKRNNKIIGDLQREITEQSKNYKTQLERSIELHDAIMALLTNLDEHNKNRGTEFNNLSAAVSSLTENVTNLTGAIMSLSSKSGTSSVSIGTTEITMIKTSFLKRVWNLLLRKRSE